MQPNKNSVRNSGIECVKIFAIILIILNHVVQTLSSIHSEYGINISFATNDIQQLTLTLMRYSGVFGNSVFFCCSAWFFIGKEKTYHKKAFFMISEIWFVSVVIFIISFICMNGNIPVRTVIKQFFPTTFSNNWYLTIYILFLLIYPYLNTIINKMSQHVLFRSSVLLVVLYIGFNFFGNFFFFSEIILWVALYFALAYTKLYLKDVSNNVKYNVFALVMGIIGNTGIIIITNLLGLRIDYFSDKLLHWNNICNPFLILSGIAILNLARNIHFENLTINYVSRLSLLIYIIHENMLIRSYLRPYFFKVIYDNFGYEYIVLWCLLLTVLILIATFIISFVYDKTLRKIVNKVIDKLYSFVLVQYKKMENYLLKIS